ncbi:MAG: cadherin repeat domain-containing protein, partial [Thermoguttaceae bacterium]
FTVTIVERPEFISFEDRLAEEQRPSDEPAIIEYNSDSYRTYVKEDADVGAVLQVRGGAFKAKGGGTEDNSTLRYRLIHSSPYFEIDSVTGVITLKKSAEEIVAESGQYSLGLGVRVYESRVTDGQSGGVGSVWSDDASINVTISHWNVNRNGNATAQAIASDGCSVDMLAKDCGLTVSEFKNWLTISTSETEYVELFNGSRVAPKDLTSSDALLASGRFAVPNVIYMAWFGECKGAGKNLMNWRTNVSNFTALGFSTQIFDNDSYSSTDTERAKNDFLEGIQTLSHNKELHGLYMMGHGDGNTIGSEGSKTHYNGPEWCVNYTGAISIDSSLSYRLGALIIHACYGDNNNSRSLVTPNNEGGIFWGVSNEYSPFADDVQPIAKFWGAELHEVISVPEHPSIYSYRIGGKQGTKTFSVSYEYMLTDYTSQLSISLDN